MFGSTFWRMGEVVELLGTVASLEEATGAEIGNRVAAGWQNIWEPEASEIASFVFVEEASEAVGRC
eukprot:4116198-Pyramimonas_sp.AAC.1